MTGRMCVRHPNREAYSLRYFDSKWLCLECLNRDGDFDKRGLMSDRRIKR